MKILFHIAALKEFRDERRYYKREHGVCEIASSCSPAAYAHHVARLGRSHSVTLGWRTSIAFGRWTLTS
jgi:hypothetical protein